MALWNLKDIYDFSKTEKLAKQLEKLATDFEKCRSELSENISKEKFLEIVKAKEELAIIAAKISSYADLWLAENTADSKRNAHSAMIDELITDVSNKTLFLNIWFKNLSEQKAQELINASGEYAYMFRRMRDFKDHTLEEKEEQIIGLKDLTGNAALIRIYDLTTNQFRFEWDGKTVQQAEITKFFTDSDPEKRIKAYDLVMNKYKENEVVLSEIYKGIVNDWKNENIKLRNYKTPIEPRNLGNDVPEKAIAALLSVAKKNSKVFQEYFKLKGKILGIKMSRYHLYAPFHADEKEYDYEASKKIVLETYKEFDQEFFELASKVFDDQHIHSEIVPNKQSGAFCYSILPEMTPYVLLNHVNKPRDVSTMAHELGHAIHSMLASHQNVFNFHSTLPLAETASVFGEMLLSEKLLEKSSEKEKTALLMQKLDETYATVQRQAFFIMFEQAAHEMISKGATVEELNELYEKNLKEQFGKSIQIPDVFFHEWKYIPHIFHTPFYCYAYSFGNLLVLALYNMYRKQGNEFIPKYKKILSYGGSKAPAEILQEVGIDITQESFWQQGFETIKEKVEELRRMV